MKTEQEIKELAEKRYGTDMNSYGGQRDGFKEGYKQCQQEQLNLHLVISTLRVCATGCNGIVVNGVCNKCKADWR